MKLTEEDKARIRILMANLQDAFIWRLSPEGFEYWDNVYQNLKDKLEEGES